MLNVQTKEENKTNCQFTIFWLHVTIYLCSNRYIMTIIINIVLLTGQNQYTEIYWYLLPGQRRKLELPVLGKLHVVEQNRIEMTKGKYVFSYFQLIWHFDLDQEILTLCPENNCNVIECIISINGFNSIIRIVSEISGTY